LLIELNDHLKALLILRFDGDRIAVKAQKGAGVPLTAADFGE